MKPLSPAVTHEDALKYLLDCARQCGQSTGWEKYGHYGYEIYLPKVIRLYVAGVLSLSEHHDQERHVPALSPAFYSAAWDLCRRGIFRPGIQQYGQQSTDDGGGGNGYSITPFGRAWLAEETADTFVPTEPERFGQMIGKYKSRFGSGFHQRAQEAVRCYGAHAFLACCVMCGAAIESALLRLAIDKVKDEAEVIGRYSAAAGRTYLEKTILKDASDFLERELKGYMTLLKYWRDESAHGKTTEISDSEAFTSLALLLRCAGFLDGNWDKLSK